MSIMFMCVNPSCGGDLLSQPSGAGGGEDQYQLREVQAEKNKQGCREQSRNRQVEYEECVS